MKLKKMITAVDIHAGTPMRVITGGIIDIPGKTVLEKKMWLETEGDDLRQLMLNEPRGYPAMCCNLLVPPSHPDADAGFIIMEHNEYPPMSGTNTINGITGADPNIRITIQVQDGSGRCPVEYQNAMTQAANPKGYWDGAGGYTLIELAVAISSARSETPSSAAARAGNARPRASSSATWTSCAC